MKCACSFIMITLSFFITTASAEYFDSILTIRPCSTYNILPVVRSLDTALFTGKYSVKLSPTGTYTAAKARVTAQKNQIKNSFSTKTPPDSPYRNAQRALEECIVNELIPFWYGTPWDFNGYTATPKKGVIACGYFVSTILLHSGFSLNRYTLAQQNPYREAISLNLSDTVGEYYEGAGSFLRLFTTQYSEGLYFVGLDNHVGFLLLRNNEALFLHASYFAPQCVTIERAIVSEAFNASTSFYLAELSTNRKLLDCWLNGTTIDIRTE